MKLLEFYIEMSLTWTHKTLISQSLVMLSTQRADVGRSLASQNKNIFFEVSVATVEFVTL